MRIVAHDAKAMMVAMKVPIEPATGPQLIGLPVFDSADLPPGVYLIDEAGMLTAGEYEYGARARAGGREPAP